MTTVRNTTVRKTLLGGVAAIVALVGTGGAFAADARLVADLAEQQNASAIAMLIKQGGDVNLPQPDGATALHWAAHWNNVALAKQLVAAGAKANAANDYGMTPLFVAVTDAGPDLVTVLIGAGADANAALPSGQTVLMTAVRGGNVATVKALLVGGAKPNTVQVSKGQNALMWAAADGKSKIVQALIAGGADVHARSKGEFTSLMFAARHGDVSTAEVLVKAGADVDAFSSDGSTPLLVATVRGNADLAMFLLDNGAKPAGNFQKAGITPLHWAATRFDPIAITYRGIDAPGEWASYSGIPNREKKLQLIKSLLVHGAEVNAKTSKPMPTMNPNGGTTTSQQKGGATPFFTATAGADPEVMRLLLANGADPLIRASDGTSPLMVACEGTIEHTNVLTEDQRTQAIQLALEAGDDVEAADNRGLRCMHLAARGGFHEVIKFVLSKGADINALTIAAKGDGLGSGNTLAAQSPRGLAEGTIAAIFWERPATAAFLGTLGAKSIGRYYPHGKPTDVPGGQAAPASGTETRRPTTP